MGVDGDGVQVGANTPTWINCEQSKITKNTKISHNNNALYTKLKYEFT